MTEFQMKQGDFVPDGAGSFCRLEGSRALVQRVLFKLTARRGAFPFLPRLGSRLHTLGREKASARQALCLQYVQEALEDEAVTVTGVDYRDEQGQTRVIVYLQWQGEALEVTADLGGVTNENG